MHTRFKNEQSNIEKFIKLIKSIEDKKITRDGRDNDDERRLERATG